MEIRALKPVFDASLPEQFRMEEVRAEDIEVNEYCVLAIDGSTSNSGIAIIREYDSAIMYSIAASREKNTENTVRYKIKLKNFIKELLYRNKTIQHSFYEEPVISHPSAVKNLFALRTFMEELIIEEEPNLDYLKHIEEPNMKWKRLFLAPSKVPNGTVNQKKAVRDKLIGAIPALKDVTQDEIDAIAMGIVSADTLRKSGSVEELKSKTKAKAFKFEAQFIGADEDEDALVEVFDVYKGPKSLLENGICIVDLPNRNDFKKAVYEAMGNEDKLLVVKMNAKRHGNTVLEYKVGFLSAQYEYLYAIVWRKSRK